MYYQSTNSIGKTQVACQDTWCKERQSLVARLRSIRFLIESNYLDLQLEIRIRRLFLQNLSAIAWGTRVVQSALLQRGDAAGCSQLIEVATLQVSLVAGKHCFQTSYFE